jgi:hypothetical protein
VAWIQGCLPEVQWRTYLVGRQSRLVGREWQLGIVGLVLPRLREYHAYRGALMNKEVKARWVEALRSGKYQQGRAALNANGKFCCLGVLCDLYPSVKWHNYSQPGWKCLRNEYGDSIAAMPPDEVEAWAGLNTYATSRLANLNDNLNYRFVDIANIIEREY